ncbi:MFS transporter [Ferruginibacter sp. HRS2-29]|uniref:MFS transporter n=1 Tax=Ferruginibacter sp. HRS2-29 TaxID=2487334 RepID=UPI0020CF75E8|nr:MFS transporter [Ferruginibacter sp. HRS2-29]MCP9751164.1 MFS transporter [Ferruginibacter sp. HRS2-29]
MNNTTTLRTEAPIAKTIVNTTVFPILFAISFSHLLNDMMQATITSVYPMLKSRYQLNFSQVGMITFVFQLTASILQPFVGNYTDKRPQPYSFVIAMLFSLTGIILLAYSFGYESILVAVGLVGIGSSIFHPEASKVSYYASGGKRGLAQSIFQLGGNGGSAIGPLLVALIVAPFGLHNLLWFNIAALIGIFVLIRVGKWYKDHLILRQTNRSKSTEGMLHLSKNKVVISVVILLVLIFSKYFYLASMTSYFTFYLIDKFHVTVQQSQFYLFIFLGAVAAGTLLGGSLGDKFGRKIIIWISILGAAPFTLLLPYANLFWTGILAAVIGLIIASAFSAILVYAQELLPGKIGMVSGLFFGFAFGMGGLGSALLGKLADHTSVAYVFSICAYLPLLGIITAFLPDLRKKLIIKN